ncbi:hypothetical protein COLO4_07098 [Corchorus olitorius]|uniref:Uncharacterized protein n=1 Tax=Corchorus olitorius TaxID=93759 RepID=A0A1R3KKW5_9ROSI|nr:hypothetical protein COLO4_07098 [Corchorus olitorius]
MEKTPSKLQKDHEELKKKCEGLRSASGTSAMYKAQHRERSVIGEVEIPIIVGSVPFNVRFQILDIDHPSYLHLAGAVPSSPHQLVKFSTPEKFVKVHGEEDFMVASTTGFSYVEPPEESYECSFRTFEVAQVIPKNPKDYYVSALQAEDSDQIS